MVEKFLVVDVNTKAVIQTVANAKTVNTNQKYALVDLVENVDAVKTSNNK